MFTVCSAYYKVIVCRKVFWYKGNFLLVPITTLCPKCCLVLQLSYEGNLGDVFLINGHQKRVVFSASEAPTPSRRKGPHDIRTLLIRFLNDRNSDSWFLKNRDSDYYFWKGIRFLISQAGRENPNSQFLILTQLYPRDFYTLPFQRATGSRARKLCRPVGKLQTVHYAPFPRFAELNPLFCSARLFYRAFQHKNGSILVIHIWLNHQKQCVFR